MLELSCHVLFSQVQNNKFLYDSQLSFVTHEWFCLLNSSIESVNQTGCSIVTIGYTFQPSHVRDLASSKRLNIQAVKQAQAYIDEVICLQSICEFQFNDYHLSPIDGFSGRLKRIGVPQWLHLKSQKVSDLGAKITCAQNWLGSDRAVPIKLL